MTPRFPATTSSPASASGPTWPPSGAGRRCRPGAVRTALRPGARGVGKRAGHEHAGLYSNAEVGPAGHLGPSPSTAVSQPTQVRRAISVPRRGGGQEAALHGNRWVRFRCSHPEESKGLARYAPPKTIARFALLPPVGAGWSASEAAVAPWVPGRLRPRHDVGERPHGAVASSVTGGGKSG